MKICMLTTSYPRFRGDYAGNFVHNLTKELVKNHIKVTVVAPHDHNTKNFEQIDGVDIYRFKYWFTKKGHRLTYGSGIPSNIVNSPIAIVQIFVFILCFYVKVLTPLL